LDFGERVAVEINVLAKALAPGVDHRAQGINYELGARKFWWRLGQVHGGDLQEDKDVVTEDGLYRRVAKVGDFFRFSGVVVIIAHATKLLAGVFIR
jgi:hypothetical protein